MSETLQYKQTWEQRVDRHVDEIKRSGVVLPHVAEELVRPLLTSQAGPLKYSVGDDQFGTYELLKQIVFSREEGVVDEAQRYERMDNPIQSRDAGREDMVERMLSRMNNA